MSTEVLNEIGQLRLKVQNNTITQEELKRAIALMREGRVRAADAATKRPASKRSAANISAEDTEDMLKGLG